VGWVKCPGSGGRSKEWEPGDEVGRCPKCGELVLTTAKGYLMAHNRETEKGDSTP